MIWHYYPNVLCQFDWGLPEYSYCKLFLNLQLTSLKELDLKKMEKFFRDMNKKKINSTLIVQNLGDFVCGANSFLRMQSKRSEDLFERFRSHGRLSRGDSNSNTATNDYGPDRK